MLDSEHKEVCIDQFMSTLTTAIMLVVCIQVKKRDVMRYTGGVPPFCLITIKPISDETPSSDLEKCTVNLVGVDVPNSLQLTRKVEYSNSQLCESVMYILFLSSKFCIH